MEEQRWQTARVSAGIQRCGDRRRQHARRHAPRPNALAWQRGVAPRSGTAEQRFPRARCTASLLLLPAHAHTHAHAHTRTHTHAHSHTRMHTCTHEQQGRPSHRKGCADCSDGASSSLWLFIYTHENECQLGVFWGSKPPHDSVRESEGLEGPFGDLPRNGETFSGSIRLQTVFATVPGASANALCALLMNEGLWEALTRVACCASCQTPGAGAAVVSCVLLVSTVEGAG